MTINVWDNFSKRVNSTKQPSGGTSINVVLKENCSMENPIFIISTPMASYTYVQAFGHYYFVSDVININASQCEVHCTLDPMATYKSDIGNTTAFVLYDETANAEIPDTRLSNKTTPSVASNSTLFFSNFSLQGTCVVTIAGEEQSTAYAISPVQVHNLIPNAKAQIENLFPASPGSDINQTFFDTFISGIVQIISSGNLASNIQDVRWLPFNISGGTPEVIKNGQYNTGIGGEPISFQASRVVTDTVYVNIPWQFSDWRNTEPYTQVYVKIPFVGFVNLPASSLKGKTSLSLMSSLDKITGDISMELRAGGDIVGTYGASTSAKIALGNSSQNMSNIVTSLLQAGASLARADIGSMAMHGMQAYTPLTMTVGGVSSASAVGLGGQLEVITVCHDTTVSPSSVSATIGTPAMAQKQIGTLSGYIQCSGASVSGSMHAQDRDTINGMLNGGFFYE